MNKSVKLKNLVIKNDTDKLTFISGPCLLESEKERHPRTKTNKEPSTMATTERAGRPGGVLV